MKHALQALTRREIHSLLLPPPPPFLQYSSKPNLDDSTCAFLDVLSQAITACSGASASGSRTTTFSIGSTGHQVTIREGGLSEGLGIRLWVGAFQLCDELVSPFGRRFLADRHVLELGSGTGICGILAAQLGARTVTLTDNEDAVIRNLRECAAMNLCNLPPEELSDSDLFPDTDDEDPKDHGGGTHRDSKGTPDELTSLFRAPSPWTVGPMLVRHCDWYNERIKLLEERQAGIKERSVVDDTAPSPFSDVGDGDVDGVGGGEAGAKPLELPVDLQYSRIIGSDLLYEMDSATMLSHTLARRLAPGGCALISGPTRQNRIFERFVQQCRMLGLRIAWDDVDFETEGRYVGVKSRSQEYEGGYRFMLVDRADAPCDQELLAPWCEERGWDFTRDDHVKGCPCGLCEAAENQAKLS